MVRRASATILASALAVALGSCGGGDGEPKRTVDARNEAIRFFEPDTPFLALIDPAPANEANPGAVISGLAGVPALATFAREDLGFAARQGFAPEELAPLLKTKDPTLEAETTELAVGMGAAGAQSSEPLVVVVTEHPGQTASRVKRKATSSGMSRAGGFDGAALYRGESASLAVRDGVVLLAPTIDRLRQAIVTRDAGPDGQLDDGSVVAALERLPEDAPLEVYADVGALAQSDAGITTLASGPTSWVSSLGEAGVAVTPGEPMEISLVAVISPEARDAVPLEEQPTRVELRRPALARTLGVRGRGSALDDALLELAPAELSLSATSDELQAVLSSSR